MLFDTIVFVSTLSPSCNNKRQQFSTLFITKLLELSSQFLCLLLSPSTRIQSSRKRWKLTFFSIVCWKRNTSSNALNRFSLFDAIVAVKYENCALENNRSVSYFNIIATFELNSFCSAIFALDTVFYYYFFQKVFFFLFSFFTRIRDWRTMAEAYAYRWMAELRRH